MSPSELMKLGINFVPTLVVFNRDHKTNKIINQNIFEEKKAFEWVENICRNRRENIIKTTEQSRKLIQSTNNRLRQEHGIMEHNPQESQGKSDTYAYWSDNMANDKNIPQPKNYLAYGSDEQNKIITLNDNNHNKVSKFDTPKLLSEIENIRKTQDLQIDSINQTHHLNVVIKTKLGEINN